MEAREFDAVEIGIVEAEGLALASFSVTRA